jgi:protein TonB
MGHAVPISVLGQVEFRGSGQPGHPRAGASSSYGAGTSRARLVGIGLVLLLHVVFIYALASGLAEHAVEAIKGPLETRIIQEIKPPPKDAVPPPPVLAPPPPPFIPPPEVQIRQSAPVVSDAITVVTTKVPPKAAPVPVPVQHVVLAPSNGGRPACQDSGSIYPSASVDLGEEGTTTINALVDVTGAIVNTRLVKSSGFQRLDDAALNGASSICHFSTPGSVDGQPRPTWKVISVVFQTESQ